MSYLEIGDLEKKSIEREKRKSKLKRALIEEGIIAPEKYKIESNVPLYGQMNKARYIIKNMKSGDSLLVLTKNLARCFQISAPEQNRFATYKKEGGAYRVWLF
jgi:hypothetical protein